MTFSDPQVRSLLDAFFVCRWMNLDGDRSAGGSPRVVRWGTGSGSLRGTGYSNVQLCVYTPEGRLFHVLTGYISAGDLVWELCHALVTYDALRARAASRSARSVIHRRADAIQRAYESIGREAKHASRLVDKTPSPDERRHAKRDRKTLKKHAYARASDVTTRMLTRGNRAGGFGGDGELVLDSKARRMAGRVEVRRTPPWQAMSEDLRAAVRAVLPAVAQDARQAEVSAQDVREPDVSELLERLLDRPPSGDTPQMNPASAPPRSRR